MKKEFVITAVGQDRPGIVAGVTEVIFGLGGNIEDSSMTILAGEFAMILIVAFPEAVDLTVLEDKLYAVKRALGLVLSIKELSPEEMKRATEAYGEKFMISVIGVDKPGIVYRVTELIASRGINITDVQTKMVGEKENPIYTMVLEVEMPKKLDIGTVSSDLAELGKDLRIDVTVRSIEEAIL